jgi:23S rRNA (guanosine2251-2'-O)-methyltransferase
MSASRKIDPAQWVWGKQSVLELLKAHPDQVREVILGLPLTDRLGREMAGLCTRAGIPFSLKDRGEIDRLLPAVVHQAVMARIKAGPSFASLEELVSRLPLDQKPSPVLLALDHIQDPQNLGAMIRTAHCTGVQGVILPKDRCCPITGTVRKAAAGALEHIPLIRVTNLVRALESLKEKGFWVLSLEAGGTLSLYDLDLMVPLVVVIGGESSGVSPLVKKRSDWLASIPLKGKVSSLNASAACAVVLYEIFRQGIESAGLIRK